MRKLIIKGYLSLEALMFVWDQYVISSDVPGYHDDLIPIICAIILMLLRDQIMACKSVNIINLLRNLYLFKFYKYINFSFLMLMNA